MNKITNNFKIYKVYAKTHYNGFALIAANSSEDANSYIKEFKTSDINNKLDSKGYEFVKESDVIVGIWSEKAGFILQEIYYYG